MRVLVYKRTHTGDPDHTGCFGCYCCMGQVRSREFDAVIGVGGISGEPVQYGIDRRVTWIGIAPHVVDIASDGHPVLGFERFYLKDDKGPLLRDKAPRLAKRLFSENAPRVLMVDLDAEIKAVLKLAQRAQPSPALWGRSSKRVVGRAVKSKKDCKRARKGFC